MTARVSTVAVDFDGVIHAYSRGWQDGSIYDEPVPGSLEALRALQRTYAVFVHTSRPAPAVARWITERSGLQACWDPDGVPVAELAQFWNDQGSILVTQRKLPAIAYIDDRAIRFTSWDQALADLAGER